METSNDLNLPRAVGVCAEEAEKTGRELLNEYEGKGIVIYYPYFIAEKSGVLDIDCNRTVIEAVDRDLRNLVTYVRKNLTSIYTENGGQHFGDQSFLSKEEADELLKYSAVIKGRYRNMLREGGSILAEWSYAFNTDVSHKPIGKRYLVFYELRHVQAETCTFRP